MGFQNWLIRFFCAASIVIVVLDFLKNIRDIIDLPDRNETERGFSLTSGKPRALPVYKGERRDESESIEGFNAPKMDNYLCFNYIKLYRV